MVTKTKDKKEETGIMVTDEGECTLPAWMMDEEFAGMGQEDIDEQVTPILHLVQPGSPEAREGSAGIGELFIRGINHPLGKTVTVVALLTSKEWVLWRDRDEGKGIIFRGSKVGMEGHTPGSTEWDEANKKPPLANETRNFFFIEYDQKKDIVNPNDIGAFICSMARTSSQTGSDMLKAVKMAGGARFAGKVPLFGVVFEIATEEKENGKDHWFVYTYKNLGVVKSKESLTVLAGLHANMKAMHGSKVDTPDETEDE